MLITIGINSLVSTVHSAYSNHIQLFYKLGQKKDLKVCLVNPPRMSIDRMRNMAAEVALENESEYLLFIDDDVLIPTPFDFLEKLIALDVDIAAGDVLIRGYPFNHMYFKYNRDKSGLLPVERLPKNHAKGRFDCDAVGFSLCLIKTELLRKLSKPYFITGVTNTEDIYFCMKARDKFPDCTIAVDTSIQCGHILWNEIIDSVNKPLYTKYYENLNPEVKKSRRRKPERDRGQFYLNMTKQHMGIKDA